MDQRLAIFKRVAIENADIDGGFSMLKRRASCSWLICVAMTHDADATLRMMQRGWQSWSVIESKKYHFCFWLVVEIEMCGRFQN